MKAKSRNLLILPHRSYADDVRIGERSEQIHNDIVRTYDYF